MAKMKIVVEFEANEDTIEETTSNVKNMLEEIGCHVTLCSGDSEGTRVSISNGRKK